MRFCSKLLFIPLVLLLASCGGGASSGGDEGSAGLRVLSTQPAAHSQNAALESLIIATFSHVLDSNADLSNTLILRDDSQSQVPGEISTKQDQLIFKPDTPLLPETTYTVTINAGLSSATSVVLEGDYQWQFKTQSQADASAPKKVFVYPAPGANDVARNHSVSITFSKKMDVLSLSSGIKFTDSNNIDVAKSLTYVDQTITLRPLQALKAGEQYTVHLEDVRDEQGTPMPHEDWSFTVADIVDTTPPQVLDGQLSSTNITLGVSTRTQISIPFSEPLNAGSITSAQISLQNESDNSVSGSLSFEGDKVVFVPNVPLEYAHTYTLVIKNVKDLGGNALNGIYTAKFITRDRDTTPPQIRAVNSPNLNALVDLDAVFNLEFSEVLDPATVTNSTVLLVTKTGAVVTGQVTLDNNLITFTPSTTLDDNTKYTLRVEGDVTDEEGNAMGGAYLAEFTTRDVTPPVLTTVQAPADGASGVGTSLFIALTFDEFIEPDSVQQSGAITINGDAIVAEKTTKNNLVTLVATLQENTTYTINVSDLITDLQGNAFAGVSWKFTTGDFTGPIEVTGSRYPTLTDTNVSTSPTVTVGFNEALDSTTVNETNITVKKKNGDLLNIAPRLKADDNKVIEIPLSGLTEKATYTVSITGLRDINGLAAIENSIWTFTVADTTAPYIDSRSPEDGDNTVPKSAQIIVNFPVDEDIDGNTVPTRFIVTNSDTGGTVPGEVRVSRNSLVFTPASELESFTNYLVELKAGITDLAGNALASSTWTFKTVDYSAPTGSFGLTPASTDNSGRIVRRPVIQLTLTEPVLISSPSAFSITEIGEGNSFTKTLVPVEATIGTTTINLELPVGIELSDSSTYRVSVDNTKVLDADNASVTLQSVVELEFTVGDFTPPSVEGSYLPAIDATKVATSLTASVRFDEELAATTVNNSNIKVTHSGGELIVSPQLNSTDAHTIEVPLSGLAEVTAYTITIGTGVKDLAGNALASEVSWTFTTLDATAPSLVSSNPANSATNINGQTLTTITATFDEALDPISIAASDVTIDQGVTVSNVTLAADNKTLNITHDGLQDSVTYTVTISGIDDLAGNTIGVESFSFTTGDFTAPSVSTSSPTDNAVDLDASLITLITLTFDETLDTATVIPANVSIDNGAAIDAVALVDGKTVELTPSGLQELTTYKVTLSNIDDASSNANTLASYTLTFSTGDYTAPTVMSSTPAAGASSVSTALTDITVTFSEDINPTLPTTPFTLSLAGVEATINAPTASGSVMTVDGFTLENNARYVAKVAGTIVDLSNNPVGVDTSWSFLTGGLVELSDFSGTIGTTSYVVASGLTPNSQYLVVAGDDAANDIDLIVYDKPANEASYLCGAAATPDTEACIVTSNSIGEIYMKLAGSISEFTAVNLQVLPLDATVTALTLATQSTNKTLPAGDHDVLTLSGLTAGHEYFVKLNAAAEGLSVHVQGSTDVLCASDDGARITESCVFTAEAASHDIVVYNESGVAAYSVSADLVKAYANESVSAGEYRYYKTGSLSAGQYMVTLSNMTNDAGLHVYSDLFITEQTCPTLTGLTDYCVFNVASSSVVYFAVEGIGATSFDVNVTPLQNSYTLGALPVSDTVNNATQRYQVTGLTSSTSYTVLMSGLSANADMSVSLDGTTITTCSQPGTASESCDVTAGAEGEVFIEVSSTVSADFTLSMVEAAALTSSTSTTLSTQNLAMGEAQHNYHITGLTGNTEYLISLDALTDNVDLDAYSDAFATQVCSNSFAGTARDYCFVTTNANGELFISTINTDTGTAADFNLLLETPPVVTPLDASTSPSSLAVTLPVAGKKYRVNLGALTPREINISQLDGDADLKVYSDPFWTPVTVNNRTGTLNEFVHTTANDNGELFIELVNNTVADVNLTLAADTVPAVNYKDVRTDMPVIGDSVGVSDAYYSLSGLTASEQYVYALSNLTDNATIKVLDAQGGSTLCSGTGFPVNGNYCFATETDTDSFVVVDGKAVATSATFDLDVLKIGPVTDEVFALTAERTGDTINDTEKLRYRIQSLPADGTYSVMLTGLSNDADLFVSTNPFISADCNSSLSGMSEVCLVTGNAGGELFVTVDGSSMAALSSTTFDLDVEPLLETTLPTAVAVPLGVNQGHLFKYTGAPSATYTVTVSGDSVALGDDVDLYVFSDATYQTLACSNQAVGTGDVSCTTSGPVTDLYVFVDGSPLSAAADITVTVTP